MYKILWDFTQRKLYLVAEFLGTTSVPSLLLGPWKWDRYVVPKRRYPTNNMRWLTPQASEGLKLHRSGNLKPRINTHFKRDRLFVKLFCLKTLIDLAFVFNPMNHISALNINARNCVRSCLWCRFVEERKRTYGTICSQCWPLKRTVDGFWAVCSQVVPSVRPSMGHKNIIFRLQA
jgi:hypothetical protein